MFAYFISILFLACTRARLLSPPSLSLYISVYVCIYIHCKICHENQQKCTASSYTHTHKHSHTRLLAAREYEPPFAVFSFQLSVCSNRKILTLDATSSHHACPLAPRSTKQNSTKKMYMSAIVFRFYCFCLLEERTTWRGHANTTAKRGSL